MDNERTEDLHPRSEDIEEKVRQMLDPNIPDEPSDVSEPVAATSKNSPKTINVQTTPSMELTGSSENSLPSAPVLPKKSKAKKIIVPINSAKGEVEPADIVAGNVAASQNTNTAEDIPTAPAIKKILITDHNESSSDVAQKLKAAIADLTPDEPEAVSSDNPAEAAVTETIQTPNSENAADEILDEPPTVASPETDKAVEDIVAKESDELLEAEDAIRESDAPVLPNKKARRSLGAILRSWWSKPAIRFVLVFFIIIGVLGVTAVPQSRYLFLNTAGVRASTSLQVLDNSTQQPLKNVEIKIGESIGKTDEKGNITLQKLRLGQTMLTIQKPAFAPITKQITIGWGSNPLGGFSIVPTGVQYNFLVTDFLSGKPASKVEASIGEASAVSDEKGVIKLTLDKVADQKFTVSVQVADYRTEKLTVEPNEKAARAVKLVPARKQIFVSKRSGKYDVYSVYVDGQDEKQILAGTGKEKEGMILLPHPTDETAAYVSTRDGKLNSDGFLLSDLILINTTQNNITKIGNSERYKIVGWIGDRLIYVQIAAGASANSPKRSRLMAYNYKDNTNKELVASNYFNDVIMVDGAIYYAPSSAYQTSPPGFYKINADGSSTQKIFNQEVWNIFRTDYDRLALSVQQQWYDYRLGETTPIKLNSAPATQTSRVYIESTNAKRSAWIDKRDGKGVLLAYDISSKTDTVLHSQSGLSYPVRWLNEKVIVFRIKTDQETADYALNIDGGKPIKIKDVTASGDLERW